MPCSFLGQSYHLYYSPRDPPTNHVRLNTTLAVDTSVSYTRLHSSAAGSRCRKGETWDDDSGRWRARFAPWTSASRHIRTEMQIVTAGVIRVTSAPSQTRPDCRSIPRSVVMARKTALLTGIAKHGGTNRKHRNERCCSPAIALCL